MSKHAKSRAHSRACRRWQSARGQMLPVLAALAMLSGFAPRAGASQIQTLPLGAYFCELPGDAMHAAGIHVPEEDFAITHSSTYAAGGKEGSYLLSLGIMQMTSGPKNGEKFHRISDNFLRKLNPDGSDGELRCVRKVANNRQ